MKRRGRQRPVNLKPKAGRRLARGGLVQMKPRGWWCHQMTGPGLVAYALRASHEISPGLALWPNGRRLDVAPHVRHQLGEVDGPTGQLPESHSSADQNRKRVVSALALF